MTSLPRLTTRDDPGPGWWPVRRSGKRSAWMRCPHGHGAYLGNHTIAVDGRVTPSVVCVGGDDCQGCDFHEVVVLEGWSPTA